ncbi:MAG: energy-coupling factor transporter ATPase [Clostridia bacterium]|nr:energy-coupling factor transporter ATPase [Clostridia bacterium]
MDIAELKSVTYTYSYSSLPAVNNLDLSIRKGEFLCIVGRNGSGKSTLSKLLNGLLVPQSGTVNVFGYDTKEEKTIFEIRKRVGLVFQNPDNQMVASIIEDDVAFGPENVGIEREEIIKLIDWALESVGMKEYKKNSTTKLSGGQKQRIAIAGVLALKPGLLVLDESTAMLDPKGRKEVMKVVHELNKNEGITVCHITHYMEECIDADRIVVMDGGEIKLSGTPAEVFSDRERLARYKLALPPVMALADMLRSGGMEIGEVFDEDSLVEEICRLL